MFSKSTATHWKPVMLISQEALRYFCYAIFYRDASGYWFAYVRSFAPPVVIDTLRVEIRIKKNGNSEDGDIYKYSGKISSSEATEQEIKDSGNYLLLRDGQIKKFMVDKTIMEYNITLHQGKMCIRFLSLTKLIYFQGCILYSPSPGGCGKENIVEKREREEISPYL